MTVSTEINHEEYVGNGITYVFPYRFRILKASNMAVVSIDPDGIETILTLNTNFTLSGVGAYTGGNVTLTNPLPSGWGLTLTRELKAIQETDLRNQGTFFAETHEDAFDYLTMLIQQVGSWFTLALRKPTFLSNFYDAKQNRIVNLADPSEIQDAVNKNYSDNQYAEFNELANTLLTTFESGLYGFITVDSFEQGANLTLVNQVLRRESNGEYYRWDGSFPKVVPTASIPETSGGIGVGAWLSVGDATLRSALASDIGYTFIPSIQIQRWRDAGDIRGWGAVNGEFNDAAIASAYASGSPTIRLGGVGFVSKIANTIVHQSNKVLRDGKVVPVFSNPIEGKKAILLPDLENSSVINVEVSGTTDGGNADAGIMGYGGGNITIDSCYVHDIGLSQVSGESGFGIWWGDYANYRQTNGLTIKNSRFENVGGVGIMRGDGILVYNAINVKIHDNLIYITSRMGIAIGSDTRGFDVYNNIISNTLLASIDVEPDTTYIASNGLIYNNTCSNFAYRYSTETSGAGQTFGIDVHSDTSYIKVFKNTMSAGEYATEIFHIGSNANEIEITDNNVIGGVIVCPLFIRTFDGSGSNHITISRNRAVSTCKSFAQVFLTTNIDISDNTFSGNSSSGSYFISANAVDGLLIRGNKVSIVDNFIFCHSGNFKNGSIVNNIVSTLSNSVDIEASYGAVSSLTISGNYIVRPLNLYGIRIELSAGGSISSLNVRGNIIPDGTTKIYVSTAATDWDTLTKNTRFDVTQAYPGMQLFELSKNKVIQFLNGVWVD